MSAINWLGLLENERYLEPAIPQEEAESVDAKPQSPVSEEPAQPEKPEPKPSAPADRVPAPKPSPDFPGDDSPTTWLATNLRFTPPHFDAIQPVVDRCMALLPTIMDLRAMPSDEARRSVDFCCGVTYAIDGKVKHVGPLVYLLTPPGVEVDPAIVEHVLADIP